MTYENILLEIQDSVALVSLNRPKALNALNRALIDELNHALDSLERDSEILCIVLTGNDKAFAAGADIKEMQDKGLFEAYAGGHFDNWDRLARCRKPVVAVVRGFALGGGCELAMMCDLVIAADTARFGQPEINLGTLPGLGGTQRLTRQIGKAKTMDLCLTGRMMDAEEAERAGLVSRVVAADSALDTGLEAAREIAKKSLPALMMAKEAVNSAFETTLAEGLHMEQRLFNASFALEDKREGMTAFVEKRAAKMESSLANGRRASTGEVPTESRIVRLELDRHARIVL